MVFSRSTAISKDISLRHTIPCYWPALPALQVVLDVGHCYAFLELARPVTVCWPSR